MLVSYMGPQVVMILKLFAAIGKSANVFLVLLWRTLVVILFLHNSLLPCAAACVPKTHDLFVDLLT